MSIYKREDSKFWWAKAEIKKRVYCASMKTENQREAERREKLWVAKITGQLVTGIKEVPIYTCNDLLDRVELNWKNNRKLSAANLSLLKQTRKAFGTKLAGQIDAPFLERFLASRIDDDSAVATTNRLLQCLRRGFKLTAGLTWPTKEFTLPSEKGNERQGFFIPEQVRKLLVALPSDLADFTEFCYATGMRKGEARQITWAMIDEHQITVPAAICKNKKPHSIPLAGSVVEIINRRKKTRRMESLACSIGTASQFWNSGARGMTPASRPVAATCSFTICAEAPSAT